MTTLQNNPDLTAARQRGRRLMRIGGTALVLIGMSHFFVPTLFQWQKALACVPAVNVLGEPTQNASYLYLFNADLLLYETMLGILAFYFGAQLGQGKRSGAAFSVALGAFFALRTPMQFLYLPASPLNLAMDFISLTLGILYCYPLLHWRTAWE